MIILICLMSLLVSSFVLAAKIEIQNTQFAKAERWHQFKAVYYGDDGSVTDITDDVHFSVVGYQQNNNGEFYLSLPAFSQGYNFNVNVTASYMSQNISYVDHRTISVDATPDYLRISGSMFVNSGFSTSYRAYGHYGNRIIDISNRGNWHAYMGRIYNGGNYYAPHIAYGQYLTDTITYRFGWKSTQVRITIR